MITHQPSDIEHLCGERDAALRDLARISDAAATLMGRLHAMVSSGELRTFPEMEALEIALASHRADEP
ncbi:hypothetical protein VQH23_17100 [Pararoseomonas sp. SCSIO 73927]|uniref:hypothetical protein n=1 Tax=Pararoseomonas sp. SCSIO 73927 TaxID=3114537 RepID=UPI0030CAB0E5